MAQFGDTTVLSEPDPTVEKGKVGIMLGSSGCGQSTLPRCLVGIKPIDAGEVLLDGDVISGRGRRSSDLRRVGL